MEKVFPVSKNPNVMLNNYSGVLQIKGWQNSEVKAVCTRQSQNVEIDTEFNSNKLRISAHVLDRLASPEKAKVDCQLMTPEESDIQIRNNLGSVSVENIKGEILVDVFNADVNVTGVSGYLNVKSLGSKLNIADSRGIIQANTVSGDIFFRNLDSNNVSAFSTLGNILYDGDFLPGGKYNFSTNEGLITVLCSDNASVEWDMKTVKGSISSNLPIRSKNHRPATPSVFGKQSLIGTSNSGDAIVQLSTFSGKIVINKK
ncbi:MAG: DUF4097 family beta strand repeat-containing protein [Acidobacteriota bacterium]